MVLKPHPLRNGERHLISGGSQGVIDMVGVHGGHGSGAVAEQSGNGQLNVVEFVSDGGLAMPQGVGGHVVQTGSGHYP